jgi:5'-nucleotidase (lipoprotein e(P4) family)
MSRLSLTFRPFRGARYATVAALVVALGCAGSGVAPQAGALRHEAIPASPLSNDVLWAAESAEYAAATWQAFALARQRVEAIAPGHAPGTWAVALDSDETIISNVQYERELAALGANYEEGSWRHWVARRAAAAIPGAREFLLRVHELGGRIAIVSNRREEERADTEANLRALELPFDLVLLRAADKRKEARWAAIEAGATGSPPVEILLWVGDNIQDFPNLDQDLRQQPTSALAPFGDRYIVLPNPMYGSWER